MNLPKYSMGIGDRFAHQGKAQLAAFVNAKQLGVAVTPVSLTLTSTPLPVRPK